MENNSSLLRLPDVLLPRTCGKAPAAAEASRPIDLVLRAFFRCHELDKPYAQHEAEKASDNEAGPAEGAH
jgi:hypothetical protein